MSEETPEKNAPLQEARIVQADVLDADSVLLTFSDESSVLVRSEDLKQLVIRSGARIIRNEDVKD